MKLLLILLSVVFVCSCAVAPSSSGKQDLYNECEMSTKKLSLEIIGDKNFCFSSAKLSEYPACLLISGFIGSTTAVVSGSIVLIGNTIHWMEYQTKC